jgi:2-keto-3-deoxy-galactonokinase
MFGLEVKGTRVRLYEARTGGGTWRFRLWTYGESNGMGAERGVENGVSMLMATIEEAILRSIISASSVLVRFHGLE